MGGGKQLLLVVRGLFLVLCVFIVCALSLCVSGCTSGFGERVSVSVLVACQGLCERVCVSVLAG